MLIDAGSCLQQWRQTRLHFLETYPVSTQDFEPIQNQSVTGQREARHDDSAYANGEVEEAASHISP